MTTHKFGIGQGVKRSEDVRFLTGRGRYTDDLSLPNQAYAYLLRSPHANAEIRSLEASPAERQPGVLAVITAKDLEAEAVGTIPCLTPIANSDGSPMHVPPCPVLAGTEVRHVGEPVAMVVAESYEQARDAAEAIEVEYEMLPAIGTVQGALAADAHQIWEGAPRNVAFTWQAGDEGEVDRALAKAAHRVSVELINNRLVANSIEPRVGIGVYDAGKDRYTLYTSTHGPHLVKGLLADHLFHLPPEKFQVIARDVGGSFGPKFHFYADQPLVLLAARRIGRPVKWKADRGESFLSETHGRDHVTRAELALDGEGRFAALRVDSSANLGAYVSLFAPVIPTEVARGMQTGAYHIPVAFHEVKGVFTNTVPVDALRGAGRPECTYVIERLVDKAARLLGIDAAELRRRNLISPQAMPYTTALGATYDSGDFPANLASAGEVADLAGFPARQAESRRRNRLRGIGTCCYVERAALPSLGPEQTTVRVDGENRIIVLAGTLSSGQGHETTFAQIAAQVLGIDFERVEVRQGDTGEIPVGFGTAGSRSLVVGGVSLRMATEDLIEKATEAAADLLEVNRSDLEYKGGSFQVAGTDRRVSLGQLAAAKKQASGTPLQGLAEYLPPAPTYPNGCHICELEVDPETGDVKMLQYVVVDDFGTMVNPMIVEGQVHGGVAQGIGQALMEHAVFDPDTAQLLAGSFMDYALPRAGDIPVFKCRWNGKPTPTNTMGVKGAGEAGAVPAPAAVMNAILDALRELGVEHVDMPASPAQLWKAIAAAPGRR